MTEFVVVIVLAITFGVIVGVITLRFLSVIQQMGRAQSMDRVEFMRSIDEANVHAFTNAMTALQDIHTRVSDDLVTQFNRTMDMVHGPQQTQQDGQAYTVDQPNMDMREQGQPSDDDDGMMEYQDPTDDDTWLRLTGDVLTNGEPRTVSVPPGGSLVPGT